MPDGFSNALMPYIYYITGFSLLNPAMAGLAATAIVALVVTTWYVGMWLWFRAKFRRMFDAIFGIGQHLGIEPKDIFLRSMQATTGKAVSP